MPANEIATYYPKTKLHWRKWLIKNHVRKNAVWIIMYKQKAGKPTITWSDAVDEALCFGWIDSIKKKLDDERSIQFFSKRKPTSTWSKINKQKVIKLIDEGQMTAAGLVCIEVAKKNGNWKLLDSVEELLIPADLEVELMAKANAMDFFLSLSKSIRKAILQWVILARRPETRQNRINEIATLAAKKQKPKQF
ncbi:MAG: YdeI/OmpD-associated family protein [Ferruginibacter sp.]